MEGPTKKPVVHNSLLSASLSLLLVFFKCVASAGAILDFVENLKRFRPIHLSILAKNFSTSTQECFAFLSYYYTKTVRGVVPCSFLEISILLTLFPSWCKAFHGINFRSMTNLESYINRIFY